MKRNSIFDSFSWLLMSIWIFASLKFSWIHILHHLFLSNNEYIIVELSSVSGWLMISTHLYMIGCIYFFIVEKLKNHIFDSSKYWMNLHVISILKFYWKQINFCFLLLVYSDTSGFGMSHWDCIHFACSVRFIFDQFSGLNCFQFCHVILISIACSFLASDCAVFILWDYW